MNDSIPELLASTSATAGDTLPTLLLELSRAFAAQRVGDGSLLMEETLKLDVSWESLTRAVWLGVEASLVSNPDLSRT